MEQDAVLADEATRVQLDWKKRGLRSRYCPTCQASPGRRCCTPSGTELEDFTHATRQRGPRGAEELEDDK